MEPPNRHKERKATQFSAPATSLDGRHFDVVIVGGGINGVAVARECARGGRRTLLVEKNDFGSGTTSRATRIIHGGLRYLEHGEIGLVRESLRERDRLLRERPHLVHNREFILAMPRRTWGSHGALAIRFGLWLYRRLAGSRSGLSGLRSSDLRSSGLTSSGLRSSTVDGGQDGFERMLDRGLNLNLFSYEDGQCEYPERLVAEWLGEAMAAGAEVRNHAEVLTIDIDTVQGIARGIVLREQNGAEARIGAKWIVNATGPWVDALLGSSPITAPRLIGGLRGSHLVMRPFPGAPETAIYTEAIDRRPIFLLPWAGRLLVGTTEASHETDPGRALPSREELNYLWSSLGRLLPRAEFSPAELQYAYAGVRPLPYSPGGRPAAVTRRHIIHDHREDGAAGLLSIVGGKLTTAAAVARDCARAMGMQVVEEGSPVPAVAIVPSNAVESAVQAWAKQAAESNGISSASALAMAEWYGCRASSLATLAASDSRLRAPHTPHLVAEAAYSFQYEAAATLADILLRRVPIALGPCWSAECAVEAAAKVGAVAGWDSFETARQLESFHEESRGFLIHPGGLIPPDRLAGC